ncbi:MAG: efflux RND transporter periplasmic adaptor subunit [Proteobacteria bacterium]|nr:efflux RND transporter periplasmic adaptor subunit [Pseudomonadota bacterium]
MTLNKFLVVITALFALILLLLTVTRTQAASSSNEQKGAQPDPQIRSAQFNLSYPGFILASRQAKLAFRVKGPLVSVNVQPGDIVEKGQVLMQIDPRDFEDNIRVLEAQLAGAQAQQDGAERDFTRAQTLFEQHVSATADFDRAKSRFDSAFAGVQSVKAQLQIARHQLKDTSLHAPYAGVITTQSAENYEMVKSGEEVLGIQDISSLEVEIKVPENEIAHHPLQQGEEVTVELSAIAGRLFTAQLKEWNTAADPVTRTYALRFSFPAPGDVHVLPGMTAEVFIKDKGAQPSSLFPALQKQNTSAAEM